MTHFFSFKRVNSDRYVHVRPKAVLVVADGPEREVNVEDRCIIYTMEDSFYVEGKASEVVDMLEAWEESYKNAEA